MSKEVGASVLIVDDSYINNILFQDILEEAGFHVSVLSSGIKAFDKIIQFKPDLIILDIMMPSIDGFQVLEQVNGSDKTRHIPVVMVTADTKQESINRAMQMGAVEYITKPIDPDYLIVKLRKILKPKEED